MYCGNCGTERNNEAKFCTNCGNSLSQEPIGNQFGPSSNPLANYLESNAPIQMSFTEAVEYCFKNWDNFEGRASRSEFWYFYLFNLLVVICLYPSLTVLSFLADDDLNFLFGWLLIPFLLISIMPTAAAITRRLHDIGKTGANALWGLIPFGGIALIIWYCQQGDSEANNFGPPMH
jgi:uncharacterized membrane protein YhaH (DUF805 family)